MLCFGLVLLCLHHVAGCNEKRVVLYSEVNCRKHVANLTYFGGIGDGKTSNTKAFKAAIGYLSTRALQGGAMLVVPRGRWLTGPFNLTSHFTLYLDNGAVILASQKQSDFPLIPPLPSYGRGRDAVGPRFASLISGTNLTDVVITGANGTIDGQGKPWWESFRNKALKNTRPYLIEIIFSNQVQISNITLQNSPSWHLHPTYCENVIIQNITILAPVDSPNTDGINPDSCKNTRIWDSYIVSGDDCIAVKSGWDEYGIKFGRPTEALSIQRITCISPTSATIALGSEMSGGIKDVRAQHIYALNTESAVRIKTSPGRGGYVEKIFVRNVFLKTMKYILWMTGGYGQHADDKYNPNAFPIVRNINYNNIVAENVTMVGNLSAIANDSFTGICVSNLVATMAKTKKKPWAACEYIKGTSRNVTPPACPELAGSKTICPFPTDSLPIEDVKLQNCENYV
ncbi:Pectin lyase-like superfamily protein [Striga hermonthica]|uniref:Pectin lyase-like superfamily protein n=1 Tax=Striga hermonthica TaxID=68872 RepID=A0A9N7N7K4_STRHE|nr:Pectin lyase-like superfamily protein [Striga hermonthica]